jgi:L-ascorbate metabolism protein UlaG (beta-lactamase superfamily)
MMQTNNLIYLANAGVLINMNGKKILIDGLNNANHALYKSTPIEISEQIIGGIPPFDNIDVMLITHNHSDHFDVEGVTRFLEKNSDTFVISTHEIISTIRNHISYIEETRLIGLQPKFKYEERIQIKGIDIVAISLVHDGSEYAEVSNLAFLIDSTKKVLHLGDGAPTKENYEALNLKKYRIDLLIANFPYVSLPSARNIIKDHINPNKIAVVHLPYQELDRFGWINAAKKSYERVKDSFIETEFLENIGSSINI